jgi:drug/metabolite transporter (DMT)-like permease
MLGIALALGASVCWGSGDFLGGLTTRRASLWAVIIGSQAVGLVGAALVTVLTGHAWPGFAVVWPVLLGGVASVVAISCFYKALAIGSMSIVAPISATSAMIPFLVGLALGERPGAAQLAGVVLAAVGVVLVASERSRAGDTIGAAALPNEPAIQPAALDPRPDQRNQRRAIALSLLAAVCMGLVLVGYDATAKHDALWAMLGGRMSSAVLFFMVFLALRPHVELRRSAVPFIVAVGLLDTGANGLFALATTRGYLSIVAVIGSVYPVVTVVLAYIVLRERLARHQLAGALATLAGIALIAAG